MKVRILVVLLILIAGISVAGRTITESTSTENTYAELLESARVNAEKGLPYLAVKKYSQAFAIQCESEEDYQAYMEQCALLGEDYYESALNSYVSYFPDSSYAYELLCKKYYEQGSYSKLLSTALEASSLGIVTDEIRDYYVECAYMYKYLRSGMEWAGNFLGSYALVKENGLYGYVNLDGSYLIAPLYDDAQPMVGSCAAVCQDGSWYMINSLGFKVAIPSEEVDYMSILNNGKLLVSKDGKYGYTDESMNIPSELPYDAASNYKNNVAAVCVSGSWKLIDTDGNPISDETFEDVYLDEYHVCVSEGVIFAKKGGLYYLYDTDGNRISENGFEDVYPFAEDGAYAAVCIDSKWGFIDASGTIVIEPTYDEAKSFSCGLAAVKVDGMWGYINKSGVYRLEPQFTDAKTFSSGGIAAIEEDGVWSYIELYSYYYAS